MRNRSSEIVDIDYWVVRVPLDNAVQLATRRVAARDWLIVQVKTFDGIEGVGFTYAGYEGGELLGLATKLLLIPTALNQDASNPRMLWDQMVRKTVVQGRGGIVQRAISAIDIALWDRNAKSANLPLHRYLNPESSKTIPFYVGGGYYRNNDETGELLAAELQGYVDAGYSAVKIKAGRLIKDGERRRAQIARDVMGNNTDLVFDANGAFETIENALDFIDVYAEVAPLFIEDPMGSWALDKYEKLSRLSPIPISTGEALTTEDDFEVLLRAKEVKVLQVDATSFGGITAFLRLADRAVAEHIAIETHWFPELHAHLAAARPIIRRVEYFPDASAVNFGTLIDSELTHSNSRLHLTNTPGLGISLNIPAIQTYNVYLSKM